MVKNVLFRFNLKGEGIINYDSADQSFIHNSLKTLFKGNRNSNVNYAKKHFYKDEEGNVNWKIIVSSNCLRHGIFIKDAYSQNPSILKDDYLSYNYIASPANILRGYVFANSSPNGTIKKKSAITITDAEQICNSMSIIEQFSKTGNKKSGKVDADGVDVASDTMFSKETVGHIEYGGHGVIDLMQLQFVSCSQEFDRYGFNPDNINLYKGVLNSHLEHHGIKDDIKIDNYLIKNSSVLLSEEGILFSNDTINLFVKEFFKRMLSLDIRRSGSFAKLSFLEYKYVVNPLEDTYTSEDGWNTITSENDIKNISFEMENFYELAKSEDVLRTKEAIAKFIEEDTKVRQEKKTEKNAVTALKKAKSKSDGDITLGNFKPSDKPSDNTSDK